MIFPFNHIGRAQSPKQFLAPEVVQTSAMDCGPAALKCLLEGFNIPVSYGRLREACQTDVDGTSIDALETILGQIGLEAEQIMVPADHVFLPEARALPAIVVVELPNGFTHFVVAWGTIGPFVQVMDPATGRYWASLKRFLRELYIHTHPVPAAAWREWVGSDEFLGALHHRLKSLGLANSESKGLIEESLSDLSWTSMACLDAATRMVATLAGSRSIHRGRQAANLLKTAYRQAQANAPDLTVIPPSYWSVQPAPLNTDGEEQLLLSGALLVRVRHPSGVPTANDEAQSENTYPTLSPDLEAALKEKPVQPLRHLWRYLRADGLLAPMFLLATLFFAACGTITEALFFRGLLGILTPLGISSQRAEFTLALLIFVGILLLLESNIAANTLRFGRLLENRLRMAFLEKIPRLAYQYFRSRPMSDMADRSHNSHQVRHLPELGRHFFHMIFEIGLTTAGMIWLHPVMAPVVVLAAILALIVPLLFYPFIVERDLRFRTHNGALSIFFLDVLLGLVPVRIHGAEASVRSEYESLLVKWARAKFRVLTLAIARDGVQVALVLTCVAWVIVHYFIHVNSPGGALLLAYWGLALPFRGREVLRAVEEYVSRRNITLRLLEPLHTPETEEAAELESMDSASELHSNPSIAASRGASIVMKNVGVRTAGHIILDNINVVIESGAHIAIVGPSGAGKSSLVGLLLGWQRAGIGEVLVDGMPLHRHCLAQLRRETAWVDPSIRLWNESLLDNIRYGAIDSEVRPISQMIEQADLLTMLRNLPNGLQTSLGEGGCLVSGGEGQRVRLARAMFRSGVKLVILDEPFRGLEYAQRQGLLKRVRKLWQDATLLCITHDIAETLTFDRVLVLEHGNIVEDGYPVELAALSDSRYKAMLVAETWMREHGWVGQGWRSMWMEDGYLFDNKAANVRPTK